MTISASAGADRERWALPRRRTIRKRFTLRIRRRGNRRTAEKHLWDLRARRAETTTSEFGSAQSIHRSSRFRRTRGGHQRERRRDLEQLVQPADWAVLSRDHG